MPDKQRQKAVEEMKRKKAEEERKADPVITQPDAAFYKPKGQPIEFHGVEKEKIMPSPELLAEQKVEKEVGEKFTPEVEEALMKGMGEAGVFKETKEEPIIPEELKGLGVMTDIALGVLGARPGAKGIIELVTGKKPLLTAGQKELQRLQDENKIRELTLDEEEMRRQILVGELQATTSDVIDGETEMQLSYMGIPPIAWGIIGVGLGNILLQPINQWIGEDKKVKNFEMGLSQMNEMITLPSQSVSVGAMSPQQAYDKLDSYENIVDALERELKIASITSANVRISDRALAIQTRILKLRDKLQAERREIAVYQLKITLGTENPAIINSYLIRLEEKFKQMDAQRI